MIKVYCDYVSNKGGHVYGSLAKSAKSVVVDGNPTKWTIDNLHDKGYEVYHLVDVIKYIEKKWKLSEVIEYG